MKICVKRIKFNIALYALISMSFFLKTPKPQVRNFTNTSLIFFYIENNIFVWKIKKSLVYKNIKIQYCIISTGIHLLFFVKIKPQVRNFTNSSLIFFT